jgi:hypothetical protein
VILAFELRTTYQNTRISGQILFNRRSLQKIAFMAISRAMSNKQSFAVPAAFFLCCLMMAGGGCVSSNVKSPEARRDTGYVDFYTAVPQELSWTVENFNGRGQSWSTVYSSFEPIREPALRIALPPGDHLLQVRINNLLMEGTQRVKVRVEDGKVVPVFVQIFNVGANSTEQKQVEIKRPVRGVERGAKVSPDDVYLRMTLSPMPARNYEPIDAMRYK